MHAQALGILWHHVGVGPFLATHIVTPYTALGSLILAWSPTAWALPGCVHTLTQPQGPEGWSGHCIVQDKGQRTVGKSPNPPVSGLGRAVGTWREKSQLQEADRLCLRVLSVPVRMGMPSPELGKQQPRARWVQPRCAGPSPEVCQLGTRSWRLSFRQSPECHRDTGEVSPGPLCIQVAPGEEWHCAMCAAEMCFALY